MNRPEIFAMVGTVAAYVLARIVFVNMPAGARKNLPPLILGVVFAGAFLWASRMPWETYKAGTGILVWCLAPATVSLIIPLAKAKHLWKNAGPILGAIAVGCTVNLLWTVLVCRVLHVDPHLEASLRPKTSTSAIALEVARRSGGTPEAAAAFSVICGLLGSWLYPIVGRRKGTALGIGVGTVAHGIGTSRLAAEAVDAEGVEATAASGFAMAAAGIVTSILGLGWMR